MKTMTSAHHSTLHQILYASLSTWYPQGHHKENKARLSLPLYLIEINFDFCTLRRKVQREIKENKIRFIESIFSILIN